MHYKQDISRCFLSGGISKADVEKERARLDIAALSTQGGSKPLIDLVSRSADLASIETLARELSGKFKNIVVAGTGGSGLSGRTLTHLAPMTIAARFCYLENIDPVTMDELLAHIDLTQSCFLIVSKSGGTAETLAQYFVLAAHVEKKLGAHAVRERFIIITGANDSPLRASAQKRGLRILDHEAAIGGRFAVLSNVGLLPAALAGLDITALRRGAQSVVAQASSPDFAPAVGAALSVAAMKRYCISVMLPYSEKLSAFSSWYRQNWAESLGKNGKGSTPIRAVGTTDQHSQLQLYLDGPKDKIFHMILLSRKGTGGRIDGEAPDYLRGKTVGDIMEAEQRATLETLAARGCPVRLFTLDKLDAEAMGALLMHFMLEIILTAQLLGVNAFDQPAVEDGKERACTYLRTGTL